MSNVELSGKGLIGTDFAEQCRQVGKALREDFEQNFVKRQNEIADQERKQYVGQHRYYVRSKKLPNGFVQVETNEEFPLIGRLGAIGRSWQAAIAELRFAYANEIKSRGWMTLDEARKYCTRCEFLPDLTADL